MLYELLQQLIAVELADQAAGIVVICDVSGVLRQEITDDLVDGVIAFFAECAIYRGQDRFHFLTAVLRYHKFDGVVIHNG